MGRVPRTTIWNIPELTSIKHRILRGYLERWFPDVLQQHERIYLLDGFSGPGEYTKGELGSPLIAVDVLHHCRTYSEQQRQTTFVFIEEKQTRCNYLRGLLEGRIPSQSDTMHFEYSIECGEFVRTLSTWIEALEKAQSSFPPLFAFLDPFGFSDIPMSTIGRIMQHQHGEILLTFMYEPINRFLSHPNKLIQRHLTTVFGSEQWISIDLNGDREQQICDLYRTQLCTLGKASYVCMFRLKHRKNATDYFLIFCTHNLKSIEKMKEIFWQIDPVCGYTYSVQKQGKDNRQLFLPLLEPDYSVLTEQLVSHFGGSTISMCTLEEYILAETAFPRRGYREHALCPLECASRISVISPNPARKQGEYGATDLICFI
ncbi:hypothetical protein KSF_066060 [Reticulibacter mediterranei]|uniref:Three-Cys-motif partner protein TcmP n=1 Tax=Reticulibacter mediterranei TaxID=2778369 RepID=A0A8J3IM89_9CHLR|nr:three-Cys-motif partner protein TcmP [Reticulibacter mediterranei]GHO96558.1 hypothetical protein KSF_066060 [Reticulibacter mediterranei]